MLQSGKASNGLELAALVPWKTHRLPRVRQSRGRAYDPVSACSTAFSVCAGISKRHSFGVLSKRSP